MFWVAEVYCPKNHAPGVQSIECYPQLEDAVFQGSDIAIDTLFPDPDDNEYLAEDVESERDRIQLGLKLYKYYAPNKDSDWSICVGKIVLGRNPELSTEMRVTSDFLEEHGMSPNVVKYLRNQADQFS